MCLGYESSIHVDTGLELRDYTDGKSGKKGLYRADPVNGDPSFLIKGMRGYCRVVDEVYIDIWKSAKSGKPHHDGIRYSSLKIVEHSVTGNSLIDDIKAYCLTDDGEANSRVSVDDWWEKTGNLELYHRVMKATEWLDSGVGLPYRFHVICNELTEIPKCTVCKTEDAIFAGFKRGFTKSCSRECSWKEESRIASIIENQDHAANLIKVRENNLARYGVEDYYQSEDFKEKSRITKIARYGDALYNNKEKAKATNLERYGVEHLFQSVEHQAKMRQSKLEKNGTLVPKNANKSRAELEVLRYLRSFDIDIHPNDYILGNRQLDGLDEKQGLAFEYCGLYWHGEEWKTPEYHVYKYRKARNLGITLYTIFEDEWIHSERKVLAYLRARFGVFTKQVHVSECSIKEISTETSNKFFERYDLNGCSTSVIMSYGLYYNDQLLGAISYDLEDGQIIISRLSIKEDWLVVDGSLELIKSTICNFAQDVIAWSDNRWSNGDFFEFAGLTFLEETEEQVHFFKKKTRIRSSEKEISELYKSQETDLTLEEFTSALGYFKIYDCGHRKYIYKHEDK